MLKMGTAARRGAMTLTELLVVIAILAILVTLLAPATGNVLFRTRMLMCQNNLKGIGQSGSLQLRDTDKSSRPAFTDAADWYKAVLKDADAAKSILQCPEGATVLTETSPGAHEGPALAEEKLQAFKSDYRLRMSCNFNGKDAIQAFGASSIYLYLPLDGTSYFARKLTHTDYLAMREHKDAGGNNDYYHPNVAQFAPAGNVPTFKGTPQRLLHDCPNNWAWSPEYCYSFLYTADSNPYAYWIYAGTGAVPPDSNEAMVRATFSGYRLKQNMDTYWGIYAFWGGSATYKNFSDDPAQDVGFWVTHQQDGVTVLRIRRMWSTSDRNHGIPEIVKHANTVAAGVDDVLVGPKYGHPNNDAWAPDATSPESLPTVTIGSAAGGTSTPPSATSFKVSYGINPAITDQAGLDPQKILAIDYDRLVVRATDDDWIAGEPAFARHAGKVNVLFRDGSVVPMWPTEIDPNLYETRYWRP
ncbi:MAG: type II secretion system GspH family protein [Planctomycetaceae bacterium]|nr:type II secretion system GspH family protein [Planctomycetaceae bacterium]